MQFSSGPKLILMLGFVSIFWQKTQSIFPWVKQVQPWQGLTAAAEGCVRSWPTENLRFHSGTWLGGPVLCGPLTLCRIMCARGRSCVRWRKKLGYTESAAEGKDSWWVLRSKGISRSCLLREAGTKSANSSKWRPQSFSYEAKSYLLIAFQLIV